MKLLSQSFYTRNTIDVAKELLGKVLISTVDSLEVSGRIVEVEAYLQIDDLAAHGSRGQTKANASLFLEGGHIYLHQIHQQFCMDIVCGNTNQPTSVLIRSVKPLRGISIMVARRRRNELKHLTDGPGKLTMAFGISKIHDGQKIYATDSPIQIYDDGFKQAAIFSTKRIGISKSRDLELRFHISV